MTFKFFYFSYYQCDHGRASKMQCSGELTFDDEKKACVSSTVNSRSECKTSENNSKAESMKQPAIKMFCNSRVEKGNSISLSFFSRA